MGALLFLKYMDEIEILDPQFAKVYKTPGNITRFEIFPGRIIQHKFHSKKSEIFIQWYSWLVKLCAAKVSMKVKINLNLAMNVKNNLSET